MVLDVIMAKLTLCVVEECVVAVAFFILISLFVKKTRTSMAIKKCFISIEKMMG